MTNHEQRIALARACGLTHIRKSSKWQMWDTPPAIRMIADFSGETVEVPDYLNDLNAVHEAEKMLEVIDGRERYPEILAQVVSKQEGFRSNGIPLPEWHRVTATAAQRTKALLLTLGIWRQEAAALTPPPDNASPAR